MIVAAEISEELETTEYPFLHFYVLCPPCQDKEANPRVAVCGAEQEASFHEPATAGGDRCPPCVSYVLKHGSRMTLYKCSACGEHGTGRL